MHIFDLDTEINGIGKAQERTPLRRDEWPMGQVGLFNPDEAVVSNYHCRFR
jgi:hypothetical protein